MRILFDRGMRHAQNIGIRNEDSAMTQAIKAARLKRRQTLVQVAQAIGTDAGNLSRIENGKQNPSPKMAAKLAHYFGYEITEIQILYPERFAESVQPLA